MLLTVVQLTSWRSYMDIRSSADYGPDNITAQVGIIR